MISLRRISNFCLHVSATRDFISNLFEFISFRWKIFLGMWTMRSIQIHGNFVSFIFERREKIFPFTSPSSFYFIKKGSREFFLFTLFCCLTNSLQLICSWLWFCLLFNSTVFADSRELSCSFEFDRIIYTIFIRYREMMEQS